MERKKVAYQAWLGLFMFFLCLIGPTTLARAIFLGQEFTISTAPNSQAYLSAAYDAVNHHFLVVWMDDRSGTYDIYGQFLDSTGTLLGVEISISTASNHQGIPSVAYDPINQRFFVAWQDLRSGTYDIYSRLLSPTGTLVSAEIPISTFTDNQYNPLVAYDPVTQRYLVAWEDWRSGVADIYGRLLSATGTLIGSEISISTAPAAQYYPSLTYDPVNQRFLVVWMDLRKTTEYDIWGQLLSPTGTLIGSEISISTAPYNQNRPKVACDSVNQRFLVVWQDERNGATDIYGQILSASGALLGSEFTISTASNNQDYPSVVYDSMNQRFLVAWQDSRNGTDDIYGRLILRGITTTSLPSGYIQIPYTALLQATEGTLPYTWNIVGGSLPPGLTLNPTSGGISGTPSASGVYKFTVQVTEATGMTDTAILSITITVNQPPTVSLAANPSSGQAPLSVSLTATASDPDGSIAEYRWDFTDNGSIDATTTSGTTSFSYATSGTYQARVIAIDNFESTAQATAAITVTSPQGGTPPPSGGGAKQGCGCSLNPGNKFGIGANLFLNAILFLYCFFRKKGIRKEKTILSCKILS